MTDIHSTDAVVLKSIDYSDSSLIVRLFTRDYGKVTVIAKGARRSKRGLGGMLKPPNQLSITYRHRDNRDIQTLTACEFAARHPGLLTDMARSTAAMLAIEMLDKSVHEYDPQPLLYRLVAAFMAALGEADSDPTSLIHFYQLHLAVQLGFAPHLDRCVHCGKPLRTAVVESVAGHLSCSRCRPSGGQRLSHESVVYLRGLQSTHITDLASLTVDKKASEAAGQFLMGHLFAHVEGLDKLKSLDFWEQVRP